MEFCFGSLKVWKNEGFFGVRSEESIIKFDSLMYRKLVYARNLS